MDQQQQPLSELEAEMNRLQHAVGMLTKSNKEMKEAMAEDPDPEYKAAVDENLVIIAKYKARVWALQEELRRLRSLRGHGVHEPVDALRQDQQRLHAAPTATPAAPMTTAAVTAALAVAAAAGAADVLGTEAEAADESMEEAAGPEAGMAAAAAAAAAAGLDGGGGRPAGAGQGLPGDGVTSGGSGAAQGLQGGGGDASPVAHEAARGQAGEPGSHQDAGVWL